MFKLGVIGAGNMGYAIVLGASKKLQSSQIRVFDRNSYKLERINNTCGVESCESVEELCGVSDIVLIAVKPNVTQELLTKITAPAVASVVAGFSYERMHHALPENVRTLRIMPNTPLTIMKGTSAFALPSTFTVDEYEFLKGLFSAMGDVVEVKEEYMSAVTGVSGSGPAYVYMFIEALANAGVREGLPYDVALKLAVSTVAGSAEMVRESEKHPAALRDAVCSPGGTTIEAVASLEKNGFRSCIIEAVKCCTEKAKNL